MKLSRFSLSYLLACAAFGGLAIAQNRGEGPLDPAPPKGITAPEIIQKFAAREKEFEVARDSYTYRQSVKVQTLDGDTPDGEYQEVVDVLFDDKGRRIEQVVFAPQSTLQRVQMTQEDFQDIQKLMPFVLTIDEVPEYNVAYKGQQREDELNTYVFDIEPKQIDRKKRRFQGRVWVDDHDFQIVKTYGKAVPDFQAGNGENVFPKFTTYREQVDGKYWFPTYTRADDVLRFKNGPDVHLREIVKYSNYKRFESKTRIIYEGQELPPKPKN